METGCTCRRWPPSHSAQLPTAFELLKRETSVNGALDGWLRPSASLGYRVVQQSSQQVDGSMTVVERHLWPVAAATATRRLPHFHYDDCCHENVCKQGRTAAAVHQVVRLSKHG
jgi:hypothetical protein